MDKGQLDNASSAVVVRISSAEIPSLISHIEAFFFVVGNWLSSRPRVVKDRYAVAKRRVDVRGYSRILVKIYC
jgi:hypothetical protein